MRELIRIIICMAVVLFLLLMCSGVVHATEPVVNDAECVTIDKTEAELIAKTLYGEYNNSANYNQCAAVCWCILNRVDADGFGDTVEEVVTKPKQFVGYRARNPVRSDLYEIAVDVLTKYELEKAGVEDVGRVLPKEYCYFSGNGTVNTFRDAYKKALAHLLIP